MIPAADALPNAAPARSGMRLAEFVLANRESILAEWEAFALTCVPSSGTMDIAALRDHANAMLTAIVADLDTTQGPRAQAAKSKGQSPTHPVAAPRYGLGAVPDVVPAATGAAKARTQRWIAAR